MKVELSESKSSEVSDEVVEMPEEKSLKPEPKPPKKDIRVDIQILRAISIILVLLYHLEVPRVGGGFIGVDIFFVISGYLVTGSFIREIQRSYGKKGKSEDVIWKRFQNNIYISFLLRRIKRLILPSSVLLLLVLIGVCVSPLEIYRGMESIRYAALNYINFYLWQTAWDYGGDTANMNVVVHFWSLAVEWQFYYISPIIFILIWKMCEKIGWGERRLTNTIRFALIATSALTFGLSFAGSSQARFYLLHTRAWEFLVGAIVNMEENNFESYVITPIFSFMKDYGVTEYVFDLVMKIMVCCLFFALSVAGYFIPFEMGTWPGWWTLYPVCLSALTILLQRQFKRTLMTKPLILVGDWSYSIYLYHWPIIIFSKVYLASTNTTSSEPFFWGTCLFLTFCAALVSYYIIEKIPGWFTVENIWWIVVFVVFTALIVGLSFIPITYDKPPSPTKGFDLQHNITNQQRKDLVTNTWNTLRGDPNVWVNNDYMLSAESDTRRNVWLFGKGNVSRCVVLIGDSHAVQFHRAWQYVAGFYNASYYHLIRRCSQGAEICYLNIFLNTVPISTTLNSCKHMVTFIATWHYHMTNLTDWGSQIMLTATEYGKRGTVFLFRDFGWGPYPTQPYDCIFQNAVDGKNIETCRKNVSELMNVTPKYDAVISKMTNNQNFTVLDFLPYISSNNESYAYNYDYPMYHDEHHLTPYLMDAISKEFLEMVRNNSIFQREFERKL